MAVYLITSGRFRLSDGSVRGPGETIELDDDVAALSAAHIERVSNSLLIRPAGSDESVGNLGVVEHGDVR